MTMQATETEAIRKSVIVPLPVEKAFRLFTDGASSWWPLASHSIGDDEVESVTFDPERKLVYERHADGTEHDWGDITAWNPPNRLALNWRVNPEKIGTEVEVRFSADGDGTRVDLEHRGWENTAPGERSSYDGGWDVVLGKYVGAA